MRYCRWTPFTCLLCWLVLGCGSGEDSGSGNAATDAGTDTLGDAEADALADGGADGAVGDSGADAAWPDAGDSEIESGTEASSEAGSDAQEPDASVVIEGQTVQLPTGGVSARWAFEDAYDNVAGGDWYRDATNETATLAWGESYVMMALASMFRATGNPLYLERLSWHIDGVLWNRDDRRGVADYRGVSTACWQNTSYQPAQQAYCYVVHSGMLGYPMAEFARLVRGAGLEEELAWDGSTFEDKASTYVAAAMETVAAHDDQWNAAGYYVFRPDASFLGYPGQDLPLNQSNAMGRLLLALHDVTQNATYLDKATKLAQRFKAQLSTGANGEYLWNYWGGAYSSPGEDISHAAINVDFAAMAADRGIVFTAADLEGFARTFMGPVYVDDQTLSNFVGGGDTNGSSYKPQCGRWLRVAKTRTAVYSAVRHIYDDAYPPASIGSGSYLVGWAGLAEHEPIHRDHFFYSVDWEDQGDWREAEAYGANVLSTPPDLDRPAIVSITVDVPRPTDVQQWDGVEYHTIARWMPTGGAAHRYVPYEPSWPYVYWNDGVLFQFADSFVSGTGIRVQESTGFTPPAITSAPPVQGITGVPLDYAPTGDGDGARWWALAEFPIGARIDPESGAVVWIPPSPGTYVFSIRLQTDFGYDDQAFSVVVN